MDWESTKGDLPGRERAIKKGRISMKEQSRNCEGYTYVFQSEEGKASILSRYDDILKHWPVPYEELRLTTGIGSTYVIRCGETTLPALILLHGTSSNSSMWIDDVAKYSKYYHVYAVDIPGEPGKSEERQYPLAGAVYPDWLYDVFRELKLSQASIIGISLGAWLATGFAVRHPDMVEKLVLLCPSGIGRQRVSFLFKAMFYMLQGDKGYDRLSILVNGGSAIPAEAKEYTKLISKQFHLRSEQVPVYTDDQLKQLTMPVLVYAGDKDVLLNSAETITRIDRLLPHAKAKLLPGYGHVLIGFKKEITEFLSGR